MNQFGTVNPELLGLARANIARFAKPVGREKRGFVPGGDPAMGGDPAAMGGMPPGGDPAAMGGMPPGGGGMPPGAPSDPTAGMGGQMPDLSSMIKQQVQAAMGGMQGQNGQIKPKIDENVVLLQVLKILAKIADALGVNIPASEMVVTPEDLQQMAQGGPGYAAMTPDQGGGAGAGNSAIKPIEPMQGASPDLAKGASDVNGHPTRQQGVAFDTSGLERTMNKASAIARIRGQGK